ncbi:cation diffusion facilitator family transporter [Thermobrachium celere]|uniref:Cobalt-zinc-cadmium resistance protein n=1 Tax=Thermobrachium celere DSM 8682 TaxID=941824 RepID=R7RP63_9CLOT|nr:cation diffusion facilitator family transporter [Thermobrachium celere]GFR36037.1 cation diffusion facilitator transporter [Thermobrachium celere]CDF57161.1 Cobalt-zinc-cadmium resistance protein [Thermobrachium celere DSM 8682]
MEREKMGIYASWVTIFLNTALCLFKIIAGIVGQSGAMIADGVHTLSDIVATLVVILGFKISSKQEDEEHPYGHEKFEAVFTKVISIILIITGFVIGYEGVEKLISKEFVTPGRIALLAAIISILVKEAMYWYTIIVAKKIKSLSMEADAWHHRSDAFSSIGTFLGIFAARLGYKFFDPLAALIVSILIIKVGVEFYIKATKELVDESADKETCTKIKELALGVEGVEGIKSLKTRTFGHRIYVDIEILVDENLTVKEGHQIAEDVHDVLENKMDNIKHCMVHVEPKYSCFYQHNLEC